MDPTDYNKRILKFFHKTILEYKYFEGDYYSSVQLLFNKNTNVFYFRFVPKALDDCDKMYLRYQDDLMLIDMMLFDEEGSGSFKLLFDINFKKYLLNIIYAIGFDRYILEFTKQDQYILLDAVRKVLDKFY